MTILDTFKLKTSADSTATRLENIVEKEENASYQ